ncbi:Chromosome transmission fidelity protein 18 [Coniosporium tulheliwenetii]|uniref:Chromosome transmission fidelity protein 18 n=1 Tax=Coniosporium tulheliwenetii TaxID=3383036 RepID=A0ACC2YNF5_9PEZI|nr:Chromosome transmission fidelity protein 18 [Cladosporium sp. JES 115]
MGGFLMEESEDEDDLTAMMTLKRKTVINLDTIARLKESEVVVVEETGTACPESDIANVLPDVQQSEEYELLHAPSPNQPREPQESSATSSRPLTVKLSSGRTFYLPERRIAPTTTYEQLIASRSTTAPGRAQKSYYGIDIHQLMDDAARETEVAAQLNRTLQAEAPQPSVEESVPTNIKTGKTGKTLMWTEKYRARKFTDLIGDERTHRSVLRWLKAWDPIVFPGSGKPKPKSMRQPAADGNEERTHRKILLLTGPPGLGKTTLAHVCAKQAGYEIQEINASDERSKDVVKGRIRDMVGTENVRGAETKTANGKVRKAGRPVCVVVDEVDGVVSGSGGSGDGGFIKALVDLVNLDQKNSRGLGEQNGASTGKKKRKGDRFRLLRPLILICNDVYHPSLRPLRQSSIAEIIHVRKPALNMVVSRMKSIFEKEGVPCDGDGVRRLCEAAWGVSNRKEGGSGSGAGEGDIRGIMVVGEWVAGKLRATVNSAMPSNVRLTRGWVEDHVINDLSHGGGAARGLGWGGAREVVDRVFREGAGFPNTSSLGDTKASRIGGTGVVGVAEASKRVAMDRLREMVDTSGESDRIMTDCFTSYPLKPYQDDTLLTKPTTAHDWLHFHDALSSAVHGSQEWELAPYLSSSVLAFHHLFASPASQHGASVTGAFNSGAASKAGFSADGEDGEALKANRALLQSIQPTLSLPLARMYRSPADVASELVPWVLRMLAPDVKPVVVNTASASASASAEKSKFNNVATASVRRAAEKALVARAVNAMAATGVRFEKTKVDGQHEGGRPYQLQGSAQWVYRMEPPLDELGSFGTMAGVKSQAAKGGGTEREVVRRARMGGRGEGHKDDVGGGEDNSKGSGKNGEGKVETVSKGKGVKRDFFGRVIQTLGPEPAGTEAGDGDGTTKRRKVENGDGSQGRVWVSFNEGFSNAVRKPVTLAELMAGL